MGFALLNYNVTAATAGATNVDLTAATDPDFTARNGHYTFTEPYKLGAIMPVGVSVTTGRFQSPTWNALGEWTIFNANRAISPPANPQWDSYMPVPPPLPMNEEFQVQLSNNLGASTELENAGLLVLTNDWSPAIPRGIATGIFKATFTVTPTLNAWSGGQAITLSANLRGGVYVVVGATVQGAHSAFFRIIFPRYRLYMGRKLRPGMPIQTAIGDQTSSQMMPWAMAMGEWGRFHTFELPQIEVFGTAATSTAYVAFLWLVYLGEDPSLMQAGLGGGSTGYGNVMGQNFAA